MHLRPLPNALRLSAEEPIVAHRLTPTRFLQALRALHDGDHYALAVSGGGDSMGLLALAAKAAKLRSAPRFSVLTVDHGLRPEAGDEARFVLETCQQLGLPHRLLTADEKLPAKDVQQQARRMRYRLMAAWCNRHKAHALVLAHHLDDQAETVLMRLAKASGVNGLAGMAARQNLQTEAGPVVLLRPFLADEGSQLRQLAKPLGWRDDPSNDNQQFERVRWRKLMPQLAEVGLTAKALGHLSDDMRTIRTGLDARLSSWLHKHAVWHDYGVLVLPRDAYQQLDATLRNRLMAGFICYFGGHAHPLKRLPVAALAARPLTLENGAATLGGAHMRWRRDDVFLGRETAACTARQAVGGRLTRWDRRFDMRTAQKGLFVAPLGRSGVQHLRNQGGVFDKAIPAAYHNGLPGFFRDEKLLACPPIVPKTGFTVRSVYSKSLFDTVIGGGQGW